MVVRGELWEVHPYYRSIILSLIKSPGQNTKIFTCSLSFLEEDSERTVKWSSLDLPKLWRTMAADILHRSNPPPLRQGCSFLKKTLLTILALSETCRFWLWYCKHDSPLNVSWINWFIRNKIAMRDGLNWLIKDSIALIACTVAKGTKRSKERKANACQRILAHQPRQGDCLSLRVASTKLPDSQEEVEIPIPY